MPAQTNRRLLIAGVCVAVAYLAAARMGFLVAFAAEQITTVWAPTGIALAALLHWGRRLWPAIWLAAFAANAASEAPLWTAAVIATGNTLEAVVAASVLGRARGFDPALRRVADTMRFILAGAILTTIISASIGVTTLCVAGVQPWSRFYGLWSAWWLGDALGALVVAPVLLTMARSAKDRSRQDWLAAGLLILSAVIVTEIVFGQLLGPLFARGPLHYVIFPFVVVAAVRFGQPAAALLVLAASAVTIWHTARDVGPFASADIHQGLVLLQIFMGVLASTELLLAAAMT
jgi:integral membrane sensor domain MASE1